MTPEPSTDRWVVRAVVVLIGAVTLSSLLTAGYLAGVDKGIPDVFVATTSGGLGALATLLVSTKSAPPA